MISKKVTYGLLICFLGILPATVFAYVPEPIPPDGPAHVYASDFNFYGYLTSGGLSKTYRCSHMHSYSLASSPLLF